jgi:serine/threonine protein kinase/tetratricopeptide (TPR) repeat protein
MPDDSGDRNPVEILAEDFLARKRRGEKPSIAEYVARYPDLAAEIDELFPVLLQMEDVRLGNTDPPPSPIDRLGDYRILRQVGRGGMGIVYEAEQESLARRVALKVLKDVASSPQQIRRFECEARSAAKLHHTNIVPVFGVGQEAGVHYFVMQFIPGQPLDEVLKEVRRLRQNESANHTSTARSVERDRAPDEPPAARDVALTLIAGTVTPGPHAESEAGIRAFELAVSLPCSGDLSATQAPRAERSHFSYSGGDSHVLSASTDLTGSGRLYAQAVVRIGVQVADALEYAAEQGIIHRDIKPSNILVDIHGTAWVTDFGLAKVIGQESLTATGDLVGTLRYMAPERFRGHSDRRGDVYAVGLSLYEMLALKPAFDESDRLQLIRRITDDGPPRLCKEILSVPRDLATIIHKATSREPVDRYATAGELAADLRRFLDDRPIVARRPSLMDRALKLSRRYRSAVIVGAIGTILALAILAGSLGWIARDRSARFELTEREVNRALLEAADFERRAKWPEALESVKRAEGFLAVGAGEQLRNRVRDRRKDVDMVLLLNEIRQPQPRAKKLGSAPSFDFEAHYAAAFGDYGIDVIALHLREAGAKIRASSIARELTAALDHWADVHTRTVPAGDTSWKRLIAVARAADPDPWRDRLRSALEQGDRLTPNKLAEEAPVDELPMATLELLLPQLDKKHQLPVLRKAQRKLPDDHWINFKLAYGLDYEPPPLQNQDEAIRFYTAAIACRPRHAPAHYYLAHVLSQRGRVDEAIAALQSAIELDPDYTWPSALLCQIHLAQGQVEQAMAESRRLLERNSRDADAHVALAQILLKCGKGSEAVQEHETAIGLRPADAMLRNNLAWLLVTCVDQRVRNAGRAVELAKSAVRIDQKNAAAWNTLGVALYRAGDWPGAITALERSVAILGCTSFDDFFLAMAHEKLGQYEQAKIEYDRAIRWMKQFKPNDHELGQFRAEAAELLGLKEPSQPVPK